MTQKEAKQEGASEDQKDAVDPVMAQLKTMYDSVAAEPLPSDLLALLDKLDEAERTR